VTYFAIDHDLNKLAPFGVIDTEGRYWVESYQQKGAPTGKYRVTVDPGSDDKKMDSAVDPIYISHEKSPLIVTVTENPAPGAYDLKLEMRKR